MADAEGGKSKEARGGSEKGIAEENVGMVGAVKVLRGGWLKTTREDERGEGAWVELAVGRARRGRARGLAPGEVGQEETGQREEDDEGPLVRPPPLYR